MAGSMVPSETINILNSLRREDLIETSSAKEKMNRELQQLPQTLNYRANYTADFQHLMHPSCTGNNPVIVVSCYGGNMTILSTSDDSIQCQQVDGSTTYQCNNLCTGTFCDDVYVVRSGVQSKDGIFGSIRFMCESNNIAETAAIYTLGRKGVDDVGSCVANTTTNNTRNYRIARMGISCPLQDIGSNIIREYIYDDTYFECLDYESLTINLVEPGLDDVYACINGNNCLGQQCSLTYDPIQVDAQIQSFANSCIEKLVPIDPFPTPAPESSIFIYIVRFEASWAAVIDPQEQCLNFRTDPIIKLACANGATSIRFNSSTDDVVCNNTSENEMECTGGLNFKNWTGVRFDCFGRSIPSAMVTFPETIAGCDNNMNLTNLENIVTLAVECDGKYFSGDRFFECADRRSFFAIATDEGLAGDRFWCIESTTIDAGSLLNETMVIRSVSAMTDANWISDTVVSCYDQVNSLNTSAPMISTIITPIAPVNNLPTQMPTPNALTPNSPTTSSTIVISAVVSGILGGILISLFALFVYRKGRRDGVSTTVTDGHYKPHSTQDDPSDRLTEENTASRVTPTLPPVVQMQQVQPAIEIPQSQPVERIILDPPTSEPYQVHYKDQSRSVVGGIPRQYTPVVTQSSISSKPQLHDIPFATAVPVSIISELSSANTNGSDVRSSRVSVRTAAIAESSPPTTNAEGEYPLLAHGPTNSDSNIYEC